MTFAEFLDRVDGRSRDLVVVNRNAPEAVVGMLQDTFTAQPVGVEEEVLGSYDEDTVLLMEDGDVLASSPLSALNDSILLVNSDLYTTGTVGLDEFEMPDALAGLEEVPFRLQGYPESNTEKLLLILVSRYIELLSWRHEGRHRASFQRLSRIDDEVGTRAVYERLADSDADVHVYGIPDWTPPVELAVKMHGSYDEDLRKTWFVVFEPTAADGATAVDPAALLAIEVEPRTWDAFWTRDPDLVGDLARYIERHY